MAMGSKRRDGTGAVEKPGSPRGRPRSAAVDTAILRAALHLFVERGLDGVGIEQVAERAGVARTTVYRRWSSKERIVAEAIARGRGAADEEALRESGSPRAALSSAVDALARTVSGPRYRRMVARLIGSVPDHPDLMAVYLRTHFQPRRKIAADSLELARSRGLIPKDAEGDILLDLISGAVFQRLFLHQGSSSANDMRTYLGRVLRQLRLGA